MKSLEEIRKIREEKRKELDLREIGWIYNELIQEKNIF